MISLNRKAENGIIPPCTQPRFPPLAIRLTDTSSRRRDSIADFSSSQQSGAMHAPVAACIGINAAPETRISLRAAG
jgi:hypothetical protein